MKLLFLSRMSHAGGAQRWLEILCRELQVRGHDPKAIFTRAGNPDCVFHQALADLTIDHLCYRYNDPPYAQDLAQHIESDHPDIMLIDNAERLPEVWEMSPRLRCGATRVVFIAHTQSTPPSLLRHLRGMVWKTVCVSNKSAERLKTFHPIVIHNAVWAPPENGEPIREVLHIPKNAFVVGYVGRVDPNKGVDVIFEAIRDKPWWGLIAGRERSEVPIYQRVPAGIQPRVRIAPVEVRNVGDWYKAMDVFVLNSHEEGFPLAPMEALLCGTRVAMTAVSDYHAMFKGAVAFFSRNSAASLQRAILNAPETAYGEEIIAHQLSVPQMIDRYEEVFECRRS